MSGVTDVVEAELKTAPDRLRWAMNGCLAQIGTEHAGLRARAVAWIAEVVRRQAGRPAPA